MTNKYKLMLEKAKQNIITKAEIKEVVEILENHEESVNSYTLLHIIGAANLYQHKPLIEKYLFNKHNPILARLALQILCLNWHYTSEYIDLITNFITGKEWDIDGEIRLVAISIAGEFLRGNENLILLKLLLDTYEKKDEKKIIRFTAYESLARAIGLSYNQIFEETKTWDILDNPNLATIQAAYKRISKKDSKLKND